MTRSNFNLVAVITACLCASPVIAAPTDGTIEASDTAQVLQDGRTLVVMPETKVCGTPSPYDDSRFAISLRFDCADEISGVSGSVFLGVALHPGETTPREYLAGVAEAYWPDLTATERADEIKSSKAEFSGVSVDLVCIAGRDEEGTVGQAACVLDQPRTQMIMHMRSTGIVEAYGVMVMALTGMSLR